MREKDAIRWLFQNDDENSGIVIEMSDAVTRARILSLVERDCLRLFA
jgi:hypothetical protein